jgi:hypothetical protein
MLEVEEERACMFDVLCLLLVILMSIDEASLLLAM